MKELWKLIKEPWKLIKEIFILIFGGIIFIVFAIIGILYTFVKHILKGDYSFSKQLIPIVRSVTLALDGIACAGAGELLNDVLRVKGRIKYGKWYQTISAITGLVHIYEKDTWFRRFLDKILGKNHCDEAITDQDRFYYKQN
ncbi:hypothetical protein C4F50_23985 [Flavobacterium sp. KB82]|uniref:Uncharacterized protein n=2 Tax=Flavobacterium hungaricum TaxID=2082725 RepID=A0ABR9TT62_9FLAO|nr:hypothetical protein [Flavobacterium hungaricum]